VLGLDAAETAVLRDSLENVSQNTARYLNNRSGQVGRSRGRVLTGGGVVRRGRGGRGSRIPRSVSQRSSPAET